MIEDQRREFEEGRQGTCGEGNAGKLAGRSTLPAADPPHPAGTWTHMQCSHQDQPPPHLHAQGGLALIHQPPPHVIKQLQALLDWPVPPGARLPPLPIAAEAGAGSPVDSLSAQYSGAQKRSGISTASMPVPAGKQRHPCQGQQACEQPYRAVPHAPLTP